MTYVDHTGNVLEGTKPPELPDPDLTDRSPEFWTASPDHCQLTFPKGTGIEPDVPDCHIKYIVAEKSAVASVSFE